MPTPRTAAAIAVLNGQIYVMGGEDATGLATGVVERYDPVANQWAAMDSLRKERANAAAAVLDGHILLMGGRTDEGEVTADVEIYDPAMDDWESFPSMQEDREGLVAFTLDNVVYAFGGLGDRNNLRDDVEVYDSGEGHWEAYPLWTLSVPRAAFASVVEDNGVLIFGGYSAFGPLADVEFYVPGSNDAEMRATLPEPRGGLASATAGGLVYAIGGRNAAGAVVARVDRYNPMADSWSAGEALPSPREGAAAAAVGDVVYLFGGQGGNGTLLTTSLQLAVGTASEPEAPASGFTLSLAGPNPFSRHTAVMLTLDRPETVTVAVYDVLGRQVALLHDGLLGAGAHRMIWEVSSATGILPAGLYLVRAEAGPRYAVQRLTRVR